MPCAAPVLGAGRIDMNKNPGFVIWFTGLSGAGKSTLSLPVAEQLVSSGRKVEILDGDEVRTHLSKGLGFSKEDRDTNIRRIGFVAELLAKNGVVAIAAAISPYREVRDEVRRKVERHGAGFVEVYVSCPIEVLAARDVKGLYKKALAGEIRSFTGISDPYEPPLAPDVVVETDRESVAESVVKVLGAIHGRGLKVVAA
jgi:adenylyl-sulfate kinase